jgi:hypothetical protein
MANHSSDRQRMRNDLRELARLAKPGSDSPVHGFDTADSSGYVDLSAFSTSDAGWVDRELARARKGLPLPPPPAGARAIDVLTPQSMAPVSLEAFGEPEDTMSVRPSRGRRVLYAVMGLAAVGAVGFLAFTLAKHPPPASPVQTAAAAVVATPAPSDPTPPPAVTSAAGASAPATAQASAPTTAPATPVATISTTTSKAKRKSFAVASHAHPAAAPAPATAPARAAALPAVVIPKSNPSPGGDSLMDLIKKSVATGK